MRLLSQKAQVLAAVNRAVYQGPGVDVQLQIVDGPPGVHSLKVWLSLEVPSGLVGDVGEEYVPGSRSSSSGVRPHRLKPTP